MTALEFHKALDGYLLRIEALEKVASEARSYLGEPVAERLHFLTRAVQGLDHLE